MEEVSWIKIGLLFAIFMIPIWFLNFMDISIKWKLLFTGAVVIGLFSKFYLGLDLRNRDNRRRR